jgi:hypothetical protein
VDRVRDAAADANILRKEMRKTRRGTTMRATNLIKHSLAALAAGTIALCSAGPAAAAPVPSSTAAVKAAAPGHAIEVGYYYSGYDGPSAVTPFYAASYYAPYVYAAPPVYYTPLPYGGPAVVYGQPLLGPEPYYWWLYPYVRSAGHYGAYWRHGGRYPLQGYRGR